MVQKIETSQDLVAQIDAIGVEETVRLHRKPPLPTRILRDLHELYHDQDRYLSFLAHYPLIPSDLADQIASDLDVEKVDIAIGLAGNPRCPQASLRRLSEHRSAAVRHALAANPNLGPKEFQILVRDENEFVRATLASNSALPNPLQFILAEDSSSAVRVALAGRKNIDVDVVVHLANSDDPIVSAAMILNFSKDEELLQLWADGDQSQQQQLLLKRSKPLPRSVQASLRLSPHPSVCRNALQGTELTGPEMLYLAQSDDTRDRLFLAEQSDIPISIQRMLAQDASPRVRRKIASNGSIQEAIALHIVASNDLGAVRALAKNPATSDATLRELCLHSDDSIALLVAYRDDLLPEHYDLLINHRATLTLAEHIAYQEVEYTNFTEAAAQQLTRHAAPSIRAFAAGSARLDTASREQLLRDPSPQVRLRLAANPALTEQQLRHLLEDPDNSVLLAAEENFAQRIREEKSNSHSANAPAPASEDQAVQPPAKGAFFNKIASFFND